MQLSRPSTLYAAGSGLPDPVADGQDSSKATPQLAPDTDTSTAEQATNVAAASTAAVVAEFFASGFQTRTNTTDPLRPRVGES